MKWLTCNSCDEEFRIVSDSSTPVSFCPYCGVDLEDEEDEDEEDEDYDA